MRPLKTVSLGVLSAHLCANLYLFKLRFACFHIQILVGTQGLAAPTLGNRHSATGVIPPLPCGSNPFFGFFVPVPRKIKRPLMRPLNFSGGDTGTRTLDPMIKSHLLYQLSYVPKTEPEHGTYVLRSRFGANSDTI